MSDGLQSLSNGLSASIQSIVDKSEVNNVKYSIESAVPKGQNYSGVIYRVTVTGKKDGRDVTMSYIAKVASSDESLRNDTLLSTAYQREAMYYTELFPIYQRMQDDVGIPFENQFRFAECYATDKEYLNEFLIFKDLKPLGYGILDRKQDADYEHAQCALEAYGKLHAMSFVLKKREPKKFEYFAQNLTEILIKKDATFMNILKHVFERAISVMENVKYADTLKGLKDNILDLLLATLTQDEFSVLSHSDCWSGNMMFRYEHEKPVETCLIDFQLCRYGAPTIDLMYYIFTNTGPKLRKECYNDMLSLYYNTMKGYLKAFSYDIEQIYPWSRFKQDLKKTSIFGLTMGITASMVMLTDDELVPDVSDFVDIHNSELFNNEASDIYKERVNDIVKDFIDCEYFLGLNI